MPAIAGLLDWLLREDPRYRLVTQIFLRLLALIYLIAFLSTALEITGLVGERGILPAGLMQAASLQRLGDWAWLRHPSLFWLNSSNWALLGASYAGCLLAIGLFFNWRPRLMLVLLFALYLSFFQVGQVFFSFQWEFLLLESGFIAIFLVNGPNRLLVFLLHWLLFRLRFLSGAAKLFGGDPSWSGLSALNHYFETQPLPHMGAWYAHQLPEWLLRAGTGATLFIELVVPFFIFLPRPFRLFAAGVTIGIQLLIMATSNHNFVNLLTIALCLFLLDDRAVRTLLPWRTAAPVRNAPAMPRGSLVQPLIALVLVSTSVATTYEMVRSDLRFARNAPVNWVRGWGLGNVYHIFPTMQTERQELVIEGSHDGKTWLAYDFRYKPDYPGDAPRLIMPIHPRLDWMLWFVPPQRERDRHWFGALLYRLHHNEPDVTALLRHNPFADKAPRYLRVLAYRYRFSTPAQRERSGQVWQAQYLGVFPQVKPRRP